MTLHEFDPKTIDRLKHALAGGFETPANQGYGGIYLNISVQDHQARITVNASLAEIGTAIEWISAWYALVRSIPHPVEPSGPVGQAPWFFTAGQRAQVEHSFEALELAAAEAGDAMGGQLTARLEGCAPESSLRIARDNLLRAKAEIELLLEIVTLSEEKFSEVNRANRHDWATGRPAPSADAGGASQFAGADTAGPCHLSGNFGDVAPGGAAPEPTASHPA